MNERLRAVVVFGMAFLFSDVCLLQAQQHIHLSAQQKYLEELHKESRLPVWANYVCYVDANNIQSGWFMLIGYQPTVGDPFFPNDSKGADDFGYQRGLTYQEYIASETGISPMNMPISPDEFAAEIPKAMKGLPVSRTVIDMAEGEIVAVKNAVASAKSLRKKLAANPVLESKFLQDPEAQALLDAPDGTNYQSYVQAHPSFTTELFYRQKYFNAGLVSPVGGFKVYLEGNLAFERDYGSGVFEPPTSDRGSSEATKGLATRIQMDDTSTGLRFLKSSTLDGSGIGIPIAGLCDPIPSQD
jgi:hypothetical protein